MVLKLEFVKPAVKPLIICSEACYMLSNVRHISYQSLFILVFIVVVSEGLPVSLFLFLRYRSGFSLSRFFKRIHSRLRVSNTNHRNVNVILKFSPYS